MYRFGPEQGGDNWSQGCHQFRHRTLTLAEYFRSLDGDEKTVTVKLNKPTNPSVFDSESSSYLIMPMGE